MTLRRADARGRDVTLSNFWMVVAIVAALAIGYAWGRPSLQPPTATPPLTSTPPQTVMLTREQSEELAAVADALSHLSSRDRASLTPTERHAVSQAEDLLEALTPSPTPSPSSPSPSTPPTPTSAIPPLPTTTDPPESGPIVHDLIPPHPSSPPTAATPSSTVP